MELQAKQRLQSAIPDPETPEDGYFLLGFWSNAYRSNDREYFWMGAFFSRKEAMAVGKQKQLRGQPQNFRDWGKGTNKIIKGLDAFIKEAKKVGLNPRVDNLEFKEY